MATIIVTGGAGFIGSHLVDRLLAQGDKVYVFDNLVTGVEQNIPKNSIFNNVDIADFEALKQLKLPQSVDYVFHFAAQSSGEASFDDPIRDIDVNYKGTMNMLMLAKHLHCQQFIFSSSMSVYGKSTAQAGAIPENFPMEPNSYYGCNKLASEKIIKIFAEANGITYTILRFFNVYGPGQNLVNMKQGMVSIYLSYLLAKKPIVVKGNLDRYRDQTYVEDTIEAALLCLDNRAAKNQIFNIATGKKTTVKELLAALMEVSGHQAGSYPVEIAPGTPGDLFGCYADATKALKTLGWQARYDLKNGLRKMYDYFMRQQKLEVLKS